MTESKSKRNNRVEGSSVNMYHGQGPVGSSSTGSEVKASSAPNSVKMADPEEIIPVSKPVETDDRGQDLRMPPSPAPREYSDYDYYVASVWQQIERDAGLHVPYEEKARILKGLTGAEPPDPEMPPAPKCPKGQHIEVDMDCAKDTWDTLNLNPFEMAGMSSTLGALGGTGAAEALASRMTGAAVSMWVLSTDIGSRIGCTKCVSD